jgi:dynactin 1
MESEQRQKIAELERELSGVDELHGKSMNIVSPVLFLLLKIAQFESTLARLQSSEQQIEELKSQLDDALGAEEILVQLTEKNMALTDVSNA